MHGPCVGSVYTSGADALPCVQLQQGAKYLGCVCQQLLKVKLINSVNHFQHNYINMERILPSSPKKAVE